MYWGEMKRKFNLYIIILIAVFIIFSIISGLYVIKQSEKFNQVYLNYIRETSELMWEINSVLDSMKRTLLNVATDPEIHNILNETSPNQNTNNNLNILLTMYSRALNVYQVCIMTDGYLFLSSEHNVQKITKGSYWDRRYSEQVAYPGNNWQMDYYIDSDTNNLSLLMTYKVTTIDHYISYIAGVGFDYTQLDSLIHKFEEKFNCRVYLLKPDGRILLDTQFLGNVTNNANYYKNINFHEARLNVTAEPYIFQDELKNERYSVIQTVPNYQIEIAIEGDYRIFKQQTSNSLLIIFLFFLAIMLSLFATNRIITQVLHRQKQREEKTQRELNKLRSLFLNSQAHNLQTPLTLILNIAEKLFHEKELSHNNVLLLYRTTLSLKQYSKNLLSAILLKEKNPFSQYDYCDIIDEIEVIIPIYRRLASENNLIILKQFNCSTCRYSINKLAFRNILENLLSNAVKYSYPKTEIIIVLEVNNDIPKVIIYNKGDELKEEIKGEWHRHIFPEYGDHLLPSHGLGLSVSFALAEKAAMDLTFNRSPDQINYFILQLAHTSGGEK